jgi:hypothetical protein
MLSPSSNHFDESMPLTVELLPQPLLASWVVHGFPYPPTNLAEAACFSAVCQRFTGHYD